MAKLQTEIMKHMHVAYKASSLHQLQILVDDANETASSKIPKVSITRMDGDYSKNVCKLPFWGRVVDSVQATHVPKSYLLPLTAPGTPSTNAFTYWSTTC